MTSEKTVNKKDILEKITPVVEKLAQEQNLIPLETDFVKEAGNWHLRIFIYSQDHPVSHQDCENLTKNLSDYADSLIPVKYYLEVSSPGIDRKLKSSREYNIFRDKQVEIKLKQPEESSGGKIFSAKILEYDPDVGLKVEKTDDNKIFQIKEENISSVKLKEIK